MSKNSSNQMLDNIESVKKNRLMSTPKYAKHRQCLLDIVHQEMGNSIENFPKIHPFFGKML